MTNRKRKSSNVVHNFRINEYHEHECAGLCDLEDITDRDDL